MSTVSLLFKGCSGYRKEFCGHKVGKVMDYDEDRVSKLMKDMPDAFEKVYAKDDDLPCPKKEAEKEMSPPENKMVGKPEEKKETVKDGSKEKKEHEGEKEEKKEPQPKRLRMRGKS